MPRQNTLTPCFVACHDSRVPPPTMPFPPQLDAERFPSCHGMSERCTHLAMRRPSVFHARECSTSVRVLRSQSQQRCKQPSSRRPMRCSHTTLSITSRWAIDARAQIPEGARCSLQSARVPTRAPTMHCIRALTIARAVAGTVRSAMCCPKRVHLPISPSSDSPRSIQSFGDVPR